MRAAYSKDLKNRMVTCYYVDKNSVPQVARRLMVSIGLVHKVLTCYGKYRMVIDPFKQRTGRLPILSGADLRYVKALFEMRNMLYLDEVQARLYAARGRSLRSRPSDELCKRSGCPVNAYTTTLLNATRSCATTGSSRC